MDRIVLLRTYFKYPLKFGSGKDADPRFSAIAGWFFLKMKMNRGKG